MVMEFLVKHFVITEFLDNVLEFLYRESSLFTKFVRLLEFVSPNNFVNHLSRSAHISSISV